MGGVCIACLSFPPPTGWERPELIAQVLQPLCTPALSSLTHGLWSRGSQPPWDTHPQISC